MKAIWVDAGNDAAVDKLASYGIDAPYFDIRDPRVTKPYLLGVRDQLKAVSGRPAFPGVYVAWNWYPTLSGKAFAEKVSAMLEPLAKDTAPTFPGVCLNAETHDVSYIVAMLGRWRELRPKRVTSWTLEGYQGGLFDAASRIQITAANVEIQPQGYRGNMEPFDVVDVYRNLVAHGFPPAQVTMMYDAAHLPPAWSGSSFTQGRLP
jgi:hypothetical protein